MSSGIEISVGAQELFKVAGFPVTNSELTGAAGVTVMLAVFAYVVYMLKRGRYNRFVGLVQWAFEGMLGQVESVIPDPRLARKVAPLALSIFFIMLFSYWMSVLPGLDSVKYNDVPVLRSLAADLNFTFAVAIIVLITVQYHAIRAHGPIGNMGRYFRNPLKDPIGSFEGALEFIGEFSRYAALSVRMFGNCFAGEILLVIIGVLTSYFSVLALPLFMGFELFIGFVQAYVFFILTVIFTSLAVESHGSHEEPLTSIDHSPNGTHKHTAVSTE
ncbi:MAG: F0F1 ATP synthase subunit A [Candidatus Nomurabacteria bacterium]|nr:MAG: F0F1 ATP synthase subunit A [Candidatus Nomurabacteria bacterium]